MKPSDFTVIPLDQDVVDVTVLAMAALSRSWR